MENIGINQVPVYKQITVDHIISTLTISAWFSPICCLQAAPFCRHGWHLSEKSMDFQPLFLTMSIASLQNISVASLNRRISRVSSSLMVQSDVFQSSGSLLSLKSDYSQSRKSHMWDYSWTAFHIQFEWLWQSPPVPRPSPICYMFSH